MPIGYTNQPPSSGSQPLQAARSLYQEAGYSNLAAAIASYTKNKESQYAYAALFSILQCMSFTEKIVAKFSAKVMYSVMLATVGRIDRSGKVESTVSVRFPFLMSTT